MKPVGCQGRRHGPLEPRHPGAQAPPQGLDGPRRSGDLTADIVENVPGEAIHRHLTARLLQKGEDVPVAQGAVFGVELPHQGHPLPGHRPAGQGGKVPGGLVKDFLHPAEGQGGAAAQFPGQLVGPPVPAGVGRPGHGLIGPGLQGKQQEKVPVKQAKQRPPDHLRPKGQGMVPFQPLDVPSEDLHLGIPRRGQGLADQAGKVGPPAGIPRRGHQQAHLVQVIGPAAQGLEILTQAENKGIAQVIVGIAQAQVRKPPALGQDHRVIGLGVKGILEQREMGVQHGGDQQNPLSGGRGGGNGSHGVPPL